jgi:hypothetical protein
MLCVFSVYNLLQLSCTITPCLPLLIAFIIQAGFRALELELELWRPGPASLPAVRTRRGINKADISPAKLRHHSATNTASSQLI